MQKLIRGIHDFQRNVFRPQREFFEQLARGQAPEVLFITCSDSRINPNLITQTQPGELFIVRNAGNLVPPHTHDPSGEAATIEYAVEVLGVTDVIVCGHSECGAMHALVHPEKLAELPAVASWLTYAESTRRILRKNYGHLSGENLVTAAVEENVLVQIENLRTHPSVAAALAGGRLRLHGWVYSIAAGEIFAFDPEISQFEPVDASAVPVVESTRRARSPWA